jgi:ATP-dependent Clp protease ATP-binding subunit ClpC
MQAAQETARDRGHAFVGCEHVLLALTGDAWGWPAEVFGALGVLDQVRDSLEAATGNPRYRWAGTQPGEEAAKPGLPTGAPRATPRLRRCYQTGAELGRSLGHEAVGPEHLLVALAEEDNGVCRQIFDRLGIADQVAERTRRRLTSESYNVRGRCIVVSADNRYLGLPVVTGGELWVQRPNGKIVPVQEL